MPCSEIVHGIVRRLGWRRDVRYDAAIRPPETELAIRVAIDLVALLVDGTVVKATQHDQIRESGGPALRPVMNVVSLNERQPAAREAATLVTMQERPTKGRGNRASSRADLDGAAVGVMAHHHPARIARHALGRLRGNARTAFHDGLARRFGVGQDIGIDVDDDLVALARGAGIDPVMERGLGD